MVMGEWGYGWLAGRAACAAGRGPEPPKGRSAQFRRGFVAGHASRSACALAAARGHLDKAAVALSAPYPEDLTPQQRGEIGWLAARHQQAALEAILEHLG